MFVVPPLTAPSAPSARPTAPTTVEPPRPARPLAARTAHRRPPLRAVEPRRVTRGFALFVGVEEDDLDPGTDLRDVVRDLRDRLAEIAPGSEATASVVVTPAGTGGRSVDVVRSVVTTEPARSPRKPVRQRPGVVIDLSRNRVTVDGRAVALTWTELSLLRLLVTSEGQDLDRREIVEALWGRSGGPTPAPRTVDVYVRRLRAKLREYDDVVRTVRGFGYRFDQHADVTVLGTGAPVPHLREGHGA